MTRRSLVLSVVALIAAIGAYCAFVLYAMNGSYSAVHPERASYYVRYAVFWGLVAISAAGIAIGCAVIAWRTRR